MKTIEILNIPFAKLTQSETMEILEIFLSKQENHIITTPNPEGVMQARRNADFAKALKTADLSLADGVGIIIASYFTRQKLPERVRGVDTTFALFENLNKKNVPFTAYFLGGEEGVAEKAKENMQKKFPLLNVVGTHHGFFKNDKEIIDEINKLSPDILLVCTGMPRAEIWASKNRSLNTRLTLCVGGTINIMAGKAKLAPSFMRKLGLEWLWRLIREPKRFVRMLDLPRFIFAVFLNMFYS
ncbi:MAG: WecB/TagA/CpsF family glycosyltransferase [Defluviitaleaceae bacterium]|nr:WecB/TagA/CpsF family glycosyltransferase [Defluviitaleaceae bacterium]